MDSVLSQLAIYLTAGVVAVPISQRLGFGSILGYLMAGLVIGPLLGLVGGETAAVQDYAEYGVVLMLFLIGLEMHPRTLWDLRHRLLGLGGMQLLLTVPLLAAGARLWGMPWNEAVAAGMVLALSSTAIVMQTLSEERLLQTEGGRATVAVLLFQDVAAVPMLALLPLLALGAAPHAAPPAGAHGIEAMAELSPWSQLGLVVAAVALVVVGGRYLARPIYRFLSLGRLPEVHVAAALLLVVAVSLMMQLLGLSPALGSFLAGVVLGGSAYRHELEADLGPFKGLLMGLFFITVGAGIDLDRVLAQPGRLLAATLTLFTLKMAVLWLLARVFRLPPQARVLFTLALAQGGEFGFVLLGFAAATGVIASGTADALLLVIAASMVLTPGLFLARKRLAGRLGERGRRAAEPPEAGGTVIVAGMGRFGQTVNRILSALGHSAVLLDSQPATVERMRALGIRAYLGDVDRAGMLEAAGIAEARALVLAIDDPERALRVVRYVGRRYPHVRIIARARDRHAVYQMTAAGASRCVREVFDSAVRAGGHALAALGHEPREVEALLRDFAAKDTRMIAELAALWRPDLAAEENAAFLAREREQAAAIEAALRASAEAEAQAQAEARAKAEVAAAGPER